MSQEAGAVIGINIGQSYGSIACINQHGRADVIANEDGERQLATRIAFNGDQVYIGNQATPQLVRNAPNVIDRFVNLLGRSYSELTDEEKTRSSAPVIDQSGVPSFKVEIDGTETVLSAHDVAVRFIRSLFVTAKDFLSGVPIAGAVVSVPLHFSSKQQEALKAAATEAGLIVLQLLPAPAAALVGYKLTVPEPNGALPAHPDGEEGEPYRRGTEVDRSVVVVDVGGSSSSVTTLFARSGVYVLASHVTDGHLGGNQVDDALVAHFAKEFTKKTKIAVDAGNKRAWAKLRNEAELTKRALSASNSAQCSVESLAEGVDFSGSINRMRFDLLAAGVYTKVVELVKQGVEKAGLDVAQVDEIILAGGSARLPGLTDRLLSVFPEESATRITASIDSDQVLARGSAIQAQAIASIPEDAPERRAILDLALKYPTEDSSLQAPSTSRPLGLVVPLPTENGAAAEAEKRAVDGKLFVELVPANAPLPLRRRFELPGPSNGADALLSFAEGTPKVRVDKVDPPARDEEDEEDLDEDDEPEEPEEVRTAYVEADKKPIAEVVVKGAEGGKKSTFEIEVRIDVQGKATVSVGVKGGEKQTVSF